MRQRAGSVTFALDPVVDAIEAPQQPPPPLPNSSFDRPSLSDSFSFSASTTSTVAPSAGPNPPASLQQDSEGSRNGNATRRNFLTDAPDIDGRTAESEVVLRERAGAMMRASSFGFGSGAAMGRAARVQSEPPRTNTSPSAQSPRKRTPPPQDDVDMSGRGRVQHSPAVAQAVAESVPIPAVYTQSKPRRELMSPALAAPASGVRDSHSHGDNTAARPVVDLVSSRISPPSVPATPHQAPVRPSSTTEAGEAMSRLNSRRTSRRDSGSRRLPPRRYSQGSTGSQGPTSPPASPRGGTARKSGDDDGSNSSFAAPTAASARRVSSSRATSQTDEPPLSPPPAVSGGTSAGPALSQRLLAKYDSYMLAEQSARGGSGAGAQAGHRARDGDRIAAQIRAATPTHANHSRITGRASTPVGTRRGSTTPRSAPVAHSSVAFQQRRPSAVASSTPISAATPTSSLWSASGVSPSVSPSAARRAPLKKTAPAAAHIGPAGGVVSTVTSKALDRRSKLFNEFEAFGAASSPAPVASSRPDRVAGMPIPSSSYDAPPPLPEAQPTPRVQQAAARYSARPVVDRLTDTSKLDARRRQVLADDQRRFEESAPFHPTLSPRVQQELDDAPPSDLNSEDDGFVDIDGNPIDEAVSPMRRSLSRRASTFRYSPLYGMHHRDPMASSPFRATPPPEGATGHRRDSHSRAVSPATGTGRSATASASGKHSHTPAITAKGKRMVRGHQAREEWAEDRDQHVALLKDEAARTRPKECTFRPALNETSLELVEGMGDRHLSLLERTEMTARARQADSRRRIQALDDEAVMRVDVADKLRELEGFMTPGNDDNGFDADFGPSYELDYVTDAPFDATGRSFGTQGTAGLAQTLRPQSETAGGRTGSRFGSTQQLRQSASGSVGLQTERTKKAPTAKWFAQQVRSDTAYNANRNRPPVVSIEELCASLGIKT